MAVLPSKPARRLASCLLLLAALAQGSPSHAQQTAPDGGCTLDRGVYTCNWALFKTAFDSAHSISFETQKLDRQAGTQLRHLVTQLGKTPASADAPADLTMLLMPIDPTGVDFGPGDHDVATLRIYAHNNGTARGTLLWAETYRGQGDRPWPAIVHALIGQFQARFSKS
jgi:hypothetical protein